MGRLSQYLIEKIRAKTGLSNAVIVGYVLQVLFGIGTAILFFVATFFVFSEYLGFGGTTTSIGMFLLFVLLSVSAMLWTSSAKKKTIAAAEHALEAHRFAHLGPPLVTAGMQLGQRVGWRRALPALLVLVVASGIAAEWSRRRQDNDLPY